MLNTTAQLAIMWTAKSSNAKTGPIPVSTTSKHSCPTDCPFMGNGCYAEGGPLGMMWAKMTEAGPDASFKNGRANAHTISWDTLCQNVENLQDGSVWRHNQAGDLPKDSRGNIDRGAVERLARANRGKRGFTYSHHNVLQNAHNAGVIRDANAEGFTINVSGNSPAHADALADADVGPVVTVLPLTFERRKDESLADYRARGGHETATPKGRKIAVCPATYRDDVTCASCQLCQRRDRKVIVGFPAHGARKKVAATIAA